MSANEPDSDVTVDTGKKIDSVGRYFYDHNSGCFINNQWAEKRDGENVIVSKSVFMKENTIRELVQGYKVDDSTFIQRLKSRIDYTFHPQGSEKYHEVNEVFVDTQLFGFYLKMDLCPFAKLTQKNDFTASLLPYYVELEDEFSMKDTYENIEANLRKSIVKAIDRTLLPFQDKYSRAKPTLELFHATEGPEVLIQLFMREWTAAHWMKFIKEELKKKLPCSLGDQIHEWSNFKAIVDLVTLHQERYKEAKCHEEDKFLFQGDEDLQKFVLNPRDECNDEIFEKISDLYRTLQDRMRNESRQIPTENIRAAQHYHLLKHLAGNIISYPRETGHTDGFDIFRLESFTEFYMKHNSKDMENFMEKFIDELDRVHIDVLGKEEYEEEKSLTRVQHLNDSSDGLTKIILKIPKKHEKGRELYKLRAKLNRFKKLCKLTEGETKLYNQLKDEPFMKDLEQAVKNGRVELFVPPKDIASHKISEQPKVKASETRKRTTNEPEKRSYSPARLKSLYLVEDTLLYDDMKFSPQLDSEQSRGNGNVSPQVTDTLDDNSADCAKTKRLEADISLSEKLAKHKDLALLSGGNSYCCGDKSRYLEGSLKRCTRRIFRMTGGSFVECNFEGDIILHQGGGKMVKLKNVNYIPGLSGVNLSQLRLSNFEFDHRRPDPCIELANESDRLKVIPIFERSDEDPDITLMSSVVGYYSSDTENITWFRTVYHKHTSYVDFSSFYEEDEIELTLDRHNYPISAFVVNTSLSDISRYTFNNVASVNQR